jgi:hypothetical protein
MGEDRKREHNSKNVNDSNDNMCEKVVINTEAQLQEKLGVLESNLGRGEIAGESPNWNVLEDEEMTDLEHQDAIVEEPGMEETATKGRFGGEGGTNSKEDQAVRQSERIRNQGLGGARIADKASMMAKKKSLEGNNIQLKNSFAVLDNVLLINKFGKMGGDISNAKLENFDLLKDLKIARKDLRDRAQTLSEEKTEGKDDKLPSEELKYIEWKSDSSEPSDPEGFQRVSSKRKKKYKKKKTPVRGNNTKGKSAQPFDGLDPLEGEVSRKNSRYYLRREGKSIYRHSK